MPKTLWISYSWKDNTANDVDFIAHEISKRGIEVKLDKYVLSAGQRLWPQIERQITNPAQSDAWSIFMTQNSLTSEAVLEEIGFAVDRALSRRGSTFPVIGINPGDVDRSVIPASLRTRLYVDLTDADWLERIAAAVEGRPPNVFSPSVLPVFFGESEIGGHQVVEARPRAGRWFPAFIAVPEAEARYLGSVMQNPSGRPSLDGMVHSSTFTMSNSDGNWQGVALHHNITPINSIYAQLTGPVTRLLAGSIEGDDLGPAFLYVPQKR